MSKVICLSLLAENPCGSPDSTQMYFLIVFLPLCSRGGNYLPRIAHESELVPNFAGSSQRRQAKGCQLPRSLSILVSVR